MILRLLWIKNQLNLANAAPQSKIASGFLYARLNMASPPVPRTRKQQTIFQRLITYGEHKWQDLGRYPSSSIRGRVHQLGNKLIDRIPMQERMLWRVYNYMGQSGQMAHLPAIECAPGDAPACQENLQREVARWVHVHQRWRLIHGMAVFPAVLLSVLPFVKLWLAWEVFRTVTHHRAFVAAKWIRQGFRKARFQPNPQLEATDLAIIDEELPAIIRKTFNS